MINEILLYLGSIIILIWGIGHIIPTKSVVSGFGKISKDNKRIITMEWIAEGLTLCFIGAIVLIITFLEGAQNSASILVYRLCGLMLLVMAGLTALTGARTSIIPIKLCPIVKTIVAILFFSGSIL
jgi:hypothetical protein